MKKKLSKIAAVALAVVMLFGMNLTPLKAAEARAPLCPRCSGSMILVKTYSSWTVPREERCTHGFPFGNDKIKTRTVYTTITCSSCKLAYPTTTSTETMRECYGHY